MMHGRDVSNTEDMPEGTDNVTAGKSVLVRFPLWSASRGTLTDVARTRGDRFAIRSAGKRVRDVTGIHRPYLAHHNKRSPSNIRLCLCCVIIVIVTFFVGVSFCCETTMNNSICVRSRACLNAVPRTDGP